MSECLLGWYSAELSLLQARILSCNFHGHIIYIYIYRILWLGEGLHCSLQSIIVLLLIIPQVV